MQGTGNGQSGRVSWVKVCYYTSGDSAGLRPQLIPAADQLPYSGPEVVVFDLREDAFGEL